MATISMAVAIADEVEVGRKKQRDIIAIKPGGWHGGRDLKEMVVQLQHSGLAAHVVDGPKGPAGIIKAGAVSLARAAGAVVVPIYTSSDRAWDFKSWGRFMLPKPFAKVHLRFGEMLDLTTGEGDDAFEVHRMRLQQIMQPGLIS